MFYIVYIIQLQYNIQHTAKKQIFIQTGERTNNENTVVSLTLIQGFCYRWPLDHSTALLLDFIHLPHVYFPPGDSELTHVYTQSEPDYCLGDSESEFGEMCHQEDTHDIQMDTCPQICDGREHNPEMSHQQTSRRMNEEPEQRENTLCPCRATHSRWSGSEWLSLNPPCCTYQSIKTHWITLKVKITVLYLKVTKSHNVAGKIYTILIKMCFIDDCHRPNCAFWLQIFAL